MTKYDIQIFAEIVDASALSVEAIVNRAEDYVRKGANVIDLGCLPDTPFPHLEEAVGALKEKGYRVERRFRRSRGAACAAARRAPIIC